MRTDKGTVKLQKTIYRFNANMYIIDAPLVYGCIVNSYFPFELLQIVKSKFESKEIVYYRMTNL